jgi:hypothetical protein
MKVTQLLHRRDKTKATVAKVSTTKRSLEHTIASSSDDDDEDNSRLSSLSDSTTDDLTSVGEDSENMERLERSLRQKHAKACKAMAVRRKHEAYRIPRNCEPLTFANIASSTFSMHNRTAYTI